MLLTTQIISQPPPHRCAGSVRLLEAPAPLPRVDRVVLVQVARVDERLDAALVLVVLQIVQLLGGQLAVVVQIQVAKHPARLQLARRREVDLVLLLLVLAPLLAVRHDDGEPVQQAVPDGGQLLRLALDRFGGVTWK